jgi:hypothetical protein
LYDDYAYVVGEPRRLKNWLHSDRLTELKETTKENGGGGERSLEEYAARLALYQQTRNTASTTLPSVIALDLIALNCAPLNLELCEQLRALEDVVLAALADDNMARNRVLCKAYKEIVVRVSKKPTTSEELVAAELFMRKSKSEELATLSASVAVMRSRLTFLFSHTSTDFVVTAEVLAHAGATYKWVHEIGSVLKDKTKMLKGERVKLERKVVYLYL